MDLAWLVVLGMFLITCFATYGLFVNIADAKRERELAQPRTADEATVSKRLDVELCSAAAFGADGAARSAEDVDVLRALRTQELELAEACEAKGFNREASVHRGIALTVERSLRDCEIRRIDVA